MKSLFTLFSAILLFVSCTPKQAVQIADARCDSLIRVINEKDSLISTVFSDIQLIAENLEAIKARENLIVVSAETEGAKLPTNKLNEDIAAIDRLLQENRNKIAALQSSVAKLRKANLRIEGLEKMVADLRKQLDEKSEEIIRLHNDINRMSAEMTTLEAQVVEHAAQVQTLGNEKTALEERLNIVYYIVGAEKELREAQIVDKQGFIGRTLTVNRNSSLASFTQADSRLLTEVPIGHKKVTLVTTHPEGSYQLITNDDKTVIKLAINNPERFWEASKILVISFK